MALRRRRVILGSEHKRNFSDAASSLMAARALVSAATPPTARSFGTSRRVASSRVASSARPRAFGGFGLANTRDGPGGDAEPSPDEAAPLPPHFDLDTSILLAGFAFESYLSPEGGLRDADVNGGSTAYLSDFVRDVFAGIVEVTAIRAEGLPAGDVFPGRSDPYCVIATGGGSSYRTKTRRMTLDPSWDDETARLFVRRDPKAQVLIVRVLDEDLGKPDDLLGVVRVPLADVVARAASTPLNALKISIAQTQEMTLDIPEGDGAPGGGTLTLRLRYLPFNPPAAAAVAAGMKRAAKGLKRDAARATDDERRALAARLAAKAAGAVAGGIEMVAKEASRREIENQLWTVRPDGDWSVLATEGKLSVRGRDATPTAFEKTCFVENAITDTQAAVWRCARDKTIVVSFRGTEMHRPRDLITDANFAPASFSPERVPGGVAEDSAEEGAEEGAEDARVHGGFLSAYDSVRGRVFAAVDDVIAAGSPSDASGSGSGSFDECERGGLRASSCDPDGWHVFVTGHSLGGALATLFSAELAESVAAGVRACTVTMYNYGSPRVGNRAFVRRFNRAVPDAVRVINGSDLVPTLPALMGYRHVDHGVRIPSGKGGALCGARDVRTRIEDGSGSDPTRGEPSGAGKILQLADRLGVVGALGVDEETAADAADALANLVNSDALADHFEDKYYVALREAAESKRGASDATRGGGLLKRTRSSGGD